MALLSQDERRRQTGLKILVISGLVLASFGLVLLGVWPELDLAIAAWFFETPGQFAGAGPQANVFRLFAALLPFAVYAGALLLYLGGLARVVPKHLSPHHRSLLFLSLSLALGPGLLVNEVLKAHFHRPRPIHVEPFGGPLPFRPFYRPDGNCRKNCSFPSGETAAAFWTAAPAALAPPPLRAAALGGAMLYGMATGLARMAAGAHFLSDVLFSGLLMGLIIIGLWPLTPRPWPLLAREAKAGLQEDRASL
jgi:lipid A 4'-phosphatase